MSAAQGSAVCVCLTYSGIWLGPSTSFECKLYSSCDSGRPARLIGRLYVVVCKHGVASCTMPIAPPATNLAQTTAGGAERAGLFCVDCTSGRLQEVVVGLLWSVKAGRFVIA